MKLILKIFFYYGLVETLKMDKQDNTRYLNHDDTVSTEDILQIVLSHCHSD